MNQFRLMTARFVAVVFLLLLWMNTGQAQQLDFSTHKTNQSTQFVYRWTDYLGQQQSLSFSLENEPLYGAFREFIRYRPENAQAFTLAAMRRKASEADPRKIRISIQPRHNELLAEFRTQDESLIPKWQKLLKQAERDAFSAYLAKHYYQPFTAQLQAQAVKPDHLRFTQESGPWLRAIAETFAKDPALSQSPRQVINRLAGWIQTIPYSTLEQRNDSSGSGFYPPNQLLLSNRGDCDSKLVLASAILRQLYPNLSLQFAYLPNHALLALALPPQAGEKSVKIDDQAFIFLELAGPGQLPLGQLSEDSERKLQMGLADYEAVID